MKKLFSAMLLLFAMFSIAMAQPAMMTKGTLEKSTQVDNVTIQENKSLSTDRDVLYPEIYGTWNNAHYQHPNAGIFCEVRDNFATTEEYSWYQWETSGLMGGNPSDPAVICDLRDAGYIKVTVGDSYGNIGTDSIWFTVKNWVNPLDDFIMEIGEDLYPTFSGIATPEHKKIRLLRGFRPGEESTSAQFNLTPGEWIYKDETAHFQEDTLWIYITQLRDTCDHLVANFIPGLLLDLKQESNEWSLNMRTILQVSDFYQVNNGLTCAYFVYTIDQNGQRHHFVDENGNFVILPSETTEWHIPGEHPDQYYQCGVAEVLEDGSYKLLSLSNKVINPLPDLTITTELGNKNNFSIYPNPNNGTFSANGIGILSISNVLGQEILIKEINGQTSITLPKGMYFIKISPFNEKYSSVHSGTIQKVVIQ